MKLTPQKSLLFLILLTFFSCFPLLSQAADPPPCPEKEGMEETGFLLFKGPLVPCGVKTACTSSFGNIISTPCTICHLFILLKNLLDLMTSLLIIVSLFTITAGGVIYTVSAGNSQMVSLAKNLITKTLIGFGIFLLAWLIIYTVLKFVSFKFGAVNDGKWWTITCETKSLFVEGSSSLSPGQSGGNNSNNPQSPDPGNGTCDPVASGACSVANLDSSCLSKNSKNTRNWSQICNIESGGNPARKSSVDVCTNDDGKKYPFSIGLFQVNMLVHAEKSGCESGIFSGGTKNCKVLDVKKYENCVKKLQDPEKNIQMACEISNNGKNFKPWLNSSKKCNIQY